MQREKLDLTDNELYELCRCVEVRLSDRTEYWNKKNSRIFNSLFNKIYNNGMSRKKHKEILQPLVDFDDE